MLLYISQRPSTMGTIIGIHFISLGSLFSPVKWWQRWITLVLPNTHGGCHNRERSNYFLLLQQSFNMRCQLWGQLGRTLSFPRAGKWPHLTPESSVLGNIQFSQQNTGLIVSCRNQNVTCHSRFLCVVVAAADQSIIFFCFHIRIIIQLFSSFTRIIHVMALWSGKCHQQENMVIFIIRHVLYMLVMHRSTVMVRDKAPAACAREAEHQPLRR